MANNEVFANGLEVACKAADGMSAASFPDVCFTPGYPVPFANTAYAKDTKNGSTTVFITGKQVMLKDHSYFKTSTGNEPARGKKGFFTTVKKGEAYFTSWSMNVKVEGYNVCRHTDTMTHNHGSKPGNTGAWVYLDTATIKAKCKKNKDDMDKACAISDKEQKEYQRKMKRINDRRIAKNKSRKKNKALYKRRDKVWKDNHCMGHIVSPGLSPAQIKEKLKELEEKMTEYIEDIKADIPARVLDKVLDDLTDLDSLVSCSRLRFPYLIAACKAATMGKAAYDGVTEVTETIENIGKMKKQAKDLNNAIERVNQIASDTKKDASNIIFGSEESKKAWAKEKAEVLRKKKEDLLNNDAQQIEMANAQEKLANEDKCLKARRCMLVPYKKSEEKMLKDAHMEKNRQLGLNTPTGGKKDKQDLMAALGLNNPYGCCPGQTGHHLIPSAWAKENCPNYKESEAPVVCAEGTSHSTGGSHAKLHTGLNKRLGKIVHGKLTGIIPKNKNGTLREKKVGLHAYSQMTKDIGKETERVESEGTLTKKETIKLAHNSHQDAFPKSDCDEACLKAQLEAFYKDCKYPFKAKTIGGGVPVENTTDSGAL